MNINSIAKEVFAIESREIANLSNNLTIEFEKSVKAILKCRGKLIISGMGKSGIIGKKIAATMASTGTPSFFLHPAEAYHGDLGMIERDDIVLLISNSGETDEILKLVPFLKSHNNIVISMSSNPNSTLAKNSLYHLNILVKKEACPLQLAPTSSTTATLVMGDALAVALMKLRDFQDRDFAQFHPGGSLGRRLLTKAEDVMHSKNLPICSLDDGIKEIIQSVSEGKLGIAIIMDNSAIVGIITDGDIRRAMESKQEQFFRLKAKDLMSKNPKMVDAKTRLTDVQKIMTEYKVNSLLVIENKCLVGVIQIYDLGI
ncbi:Arabinose 5-phosphate isomerase [hydrothermal vent metagenome]|uniref:Arabinose 5-phosphate isomerase n=1 Tax=hydrothermal vent metagenome TaxID=652676 RepID=A0A1W1BR87_9ZZZZ